MGFKKICVTSTCLCDVSAKRTFCICSVQYCVCWKRSGFATLWSTGSRAWQNDLIWRRMTSLFFVDMRALWDVYSFSSQAHLNQSEQHTNKLQKSNFCLSNGLCWSVRQFLKGSWSSISQERECLLGWLDL